MTRLEAARVYGKNQQYECFAGRKTLPARGVHSRDNHRYGLTRNLMNLEQLKTAVDAQKKAFALLLWIKQRVQADAGFLGASRDETLGSGEACATWISRESTRFPRELRSSAEQVRTVGFVLSSIFSTSVRIAKVRSWHENRTETKMVTGAIEFTGSRNKRHVRQRQQQAANELCRLALSSLATEYGVEASEQLLEQALVTTEIPGDLNLWTYGCELVRRCEYASQGAAVHLLWLALDERTRKNLSAEIIWQARERLGEWIQTASLSNGE